MLEELPLFDAGAGTWLEVDLEEVVAVVPDGTAVVPDGTATGAEPVDPVLPVSDAAPVTNLAMGGPGYTY